jgi:hypothetical protein
MRKVIVGAQVSIDGVMQAPGTRSRISPNGLIICHYERAGGVNVADTALDAPSGREVARRERMKREG